MRLMDSEEAERLIAERVSVTRQKIVLMKGLLLKHYRPNVAGMLEASLKELGVAHPGNVILHPDVDPLPAIRQSSDWLSFSLAGCEAAWALVHSGIFVDASQYPTRFEPSIGWTTVYNRSGGHSSGWRFEQYASTHPAHVEQRPFASC